MSESFRRQCDRAVDRLERIEKLLSRKALAAAAQAAAEVFVDEARTQAAGHPSIARAIKHKRQRPVRRAAVQLVYVNHRFAHLLEYGHRAPAELVRPKNRLALKTGPEMFAASSRGGAAAARPFMRPARDRSDGAMLRAVVVAVERAIGEAKRRG